MKPINENLIKISSKTPIAEKIELSDEVILEVKGQCVKIEYNDNQDGTVNRTVIIKPFEIKNL